MGNQFKRPGAQVGEGSVSEDCLPMRGSDHPAFIEMRFSWLGPHETDPRYRHVVLPKGFSLITSESPEVLFVRDAYGYPRARISLPNEFGPSPTVSPVRRFNASTERRGSQWRSLVMDWGRVAVRGERFLSESDALNAAREWLDRYRGGWESYSGAVNFAGPPPSRLA